MNILLVTSEFAPFKGGVANYYDNLAQAWPADDKFTVLHNNEKRLIGDSSLWPWRHAFKSIRTEIKKNFIDYLMVGQILPLGTVAWCLSLFRPLKYAVFFHGMDLSYTLRRRHKKILAKMIIGRADKIICANSYVKEELDKYYPQGSAKAIISHPGVAGEAPSVEESLINDLKIKYGLGEHGSSVSLLTLGRLVKRKGIDKTIAALDILPAEWRNRIKYFIAGVGPDEDYLKNLVPSRLKNQIIFLGDLGREKWAWLNLADIFIMPARDIDGDYEGFGIVYLEANLCGKPVIAGRSGGVRDAVVSGLNGLTVNEEDENSLAEAIIQLANDKNLRDRLGQQGRARALAEFKWSDLAAKLSRAIKQ